MHPDDEPTDAVQALLRALDHPVPKVTAEAIAARARAPDRARPAWRWAAAVLLTLGVAGAAFALPGSPLRRWASTLGAVVTGRDRTDAGPGSASAPQAPSPNRGWAGIAVPPRALAAHRLRSPRACGPGARVVGRRRRGDRAGPGGLGHVHHRRQPAGRRRAGRLGARLRAGAGHVRDRYPPRVATGRDPGRSGASVPEGGRPHHLGSPGRRGRPLAAPARRGGLVAVAAPPAAA